jgi:hypothetical protein
MDSSGIYELTCNTCLHVYVEQTGRNLKQRYKEHIRYIKHNNPNSAYTLQILQNRHEFGTVQDNISLLEFAQKGSCMNVLEQYYIQKYQDNNKLKLEQNSREHNPLFEIGFNLQRQQVGNWHNIRPHPPAYRPTPFSYSTDVFQYTPTRHTQPDAWDVPQHKPWNCISK